MRFKIDVVNSLFALVMYSIRGRATTYCFQSLVPTYVHSNLFENPTDLFDVAKEMS